MEAFKHSNLPHINLKEHYQFVTFRTQESTDTYLKKLYAKDMPEKIKQYNIDTYLDTSSQGAYLNGKVISEIKKYSLDYDGKIYKLVALVVMPNHIHILFQQKDELKNIMRILKGGSAHIVNKLLERKGQVWTSDYFDKLIRDEAHFVLVYEYIKHNALKAGLTDVNTRFYGCYE